MIGHHTVLKAKFGTPPVGGEKCPVSLARMCSGNAVPPHGQIVPLITAWRASVAANQRAAKKFTLRFSMTEGQWGGDKPDDGTAEKPTAGGCEATPGQRGGGRDEWRRRRAEEVRHNCGRPQRTGLAARERRRVLRQSVR